MQRRESCGPGRGEAVTTRHRAGPSEWWTAVYGPALAVLLWITSGRGLAGGGPLVVNLAIAALVLVGLPRLRAHRLALCRYFGLGLPLLAFYVYYRGIGVALTAPGVVWHDGLFTGLEGTLWTGSLPLAGWIRGWLVIAYHAYVPLLVAATVAAFGTGDTAGCRRMERTVQAVCLSWAACYVVFLLFPVMGPRFVFPHLQWDRMGSGGLARFAAFYQEKGMLTGAAFPSAHVAGAVAAVGTLWRQRRTVFWVLCPWVLSLAGGAVYFGYHYGTDIAVGALVGAASLLLVAPGGVAGRPARPAA